MPLSPSSDISYHARQAAQVADIKGIPLEESKDEHFENPDDNEVGVSDILISNKTIEEKINRSKLSEPSKEKLFTTLRNNKEALELKQSNAKTSLMMPISATLKAGSLILRFDGCHLVPEQENFLELNLKALLDTGIKMAKPEGWTSYSNTEKEKWKRESILNRHRIVYNMARQNKITAGTSPGLPNLDIQLLSVKGSRIYVTLDILFGFDFLETEEESKDIFTLITRRSAWRLRGAHMEWMNTPALFCDRVVNKVIDGIEKLFGREANRVICWLDDLLVYAESEQQLINMLKLLLIQAAKIKVRFNLPECNFAVDTTIWCRRQLKNGFWNFSPAFYEKVLSTGKPTYRHQLKESLTRGLQPFHDMDFENIDEGIEYENSMGRQFYAADEEVHYYYAHLVYEGSDGNSEDPQEQVGACWNHHSAPRERRSGSTQWMGA
eukprot:augustus_masked-scaffold_87-processed-gene-0.32-mRNA-1 protein AED:1.00 eAED:1.00 QI:0/0/0/0/1/1/4/0/437